VILRKYTTNFGLAKTSLGKNSLIITIWSHIARAEVFY
jgi:hypothetical protein